MDNKITGAIGLILFVLFVGGLAESIGKLPFTIIVIGIICATIFALYEEMRDTSKTDDS